MSNGIGAGFTNYGPGSGFGNFLPPSSSGPVAPPISVKFPTSSFPIGQQHVFPGQVAAAQGVVGPAGIPLIPNAPMQPGAPGPLPGGAIGLVMGAPGMPGVQFLKPFGFGAPAALLGAGGPTVGHQAASPGALAGQNLLASIPQGLGLAPMTSPQLFRSTVPATPGFSTGALSRGSVAQSVVSLKQAYSPLAGGVWLQPAVAGGGVVGNCVCVAGIDVITDLESAQEVLYRIGVEDPHEAVDILLGALRQRQEFNRRRLAEEVNKRRERLTNALLNKLLVDFNRGALSTYGLSQKEKEGRAKIESELAPLSGDSALPPGEVLGLTKSPGGRSFFVFIVVVSYSCGCDLAVTRSVRSRQNPTWRDEIQLPAAGHPGKFIEYASYGGSAGCLFVYADTPAMKDAPYHFQVHAVASRDGCQTGTDAEQFTISEAGEVSTEPVEGLR